MLKYQMGDRERVQLHVLRILMEQILVAHLHHLLLPVTNRNVGRMYQLQS